MFSIFTPSRKKHPVSASFSHSANVRKGSSIRPNGSRVGANASLTPDLIIYDNVSSSPSSTVSNSFRMYCWGLNVNSVNFSELKSILVNYVNMFGWGDYVDLLRVLGSRGVVDFELGLKIGGEGCGKV